MFKWLTMAGKKLSPKRRVTALLVAFVDAFFEQYRLKIKTKIGSVEVEHTIYVEPTPMEWDDLDKVAEAE